MPFNAGRKPKLLSRNPAMQRRPITGREWAAFLQELERKVIEPFDQPVSKSKTTAQNIASSTDLADDDHMTGWELEALRFYKITSFLMCKQNVGNIQWKFNFSETPAASEGFLLQAIDTNEVVRFDFISELTGTKTLTTMTDNLEFALILTAGFQANATTGGKVDFQWSQETSSANNTTIQEGSWITITKTPSIQL